MSDPAPITDRVEVLNRQVHPSRIDPVEGVLWEAFNPGHRDHRKLSTLRGSVAPEDAYRRHTEDAGLESAGTWGVGVGEALDGSLVCLDDGGCDANPVDHASVDFNAVATRGGRQQAARKLWQAAMTRGPLFAAPER